MWADEQPGPASFCLVAQHIKEIQESKTSIAHSQVALINRTGRDTAASVLPKDRTKNKRDWNRIKMGLSRESRIITLLVIDTVFFMIVSTFPGKGSLSKVIFRDCENATGLHTAAINRIPGLHALQNFLLVRNYVVVSIAH